MLNSDRPHSDLSSDLSRSDLPRPRRADGDSLAVTTEPDLRVVTDEDPHPQIDRDTARGLAMAYRQSAAERALRITELVRELQEREDELTEALARAEAAESRLAELEVHGPAGTGRTAGASAPALPRQRRGSLLRRGATR